MLLLALAFHAGMLAIASSCILPVLSFAGNHGDTEERNQSNGFRMVNPLGFGEGSLPRRRIAVCLRPDKAIGCHQAPRGSRLEGLRLSCI
jgi:hypothetical protein